MNNTELIEIVKQAIKNTCFKTIANNESLLESGIIDSIALIDLSVALEQRFSITIPFVDVNKQHFETVEKIADYLKIRLA